MINEADENGNGEISFSEFKNFISFLFWVPSPALSIEKAAVLE